MNVQYSQLISMYCKKENGLYLKKSKFAFFSLSDIFGSIVPKLLN